MGRITEAVDFINRKIVPTAMETKFKYTHSGREELMFLRKEYGRFSVRRK